MVEIQSTIGGLLRAATIQWDGVLGSDKVVIWGLGMFGDGGRMACGWFTAAKWISCGGFPAGDGFGLESWVSSGWYEYNGHWDF